MKSDEYRNSFVTFDANLNQNIQLLLPFLHLFTEFYYFHHLSFFNLPAFQSVKFKFCIKKR